MNLEDPAVIAAAVEQLHQAADEVVERAATAFEQGIAAGLTKVQALLDDYKVTITFERRQP